MNAARGYPFDGRVKHPDPGSMGDHRVMFGPPGHREDLWGAGLLQSTPVAERLNMTDKKTGPESGVSGIIEDVKGKAKEAVGTVTGRDDLAREGEAQQDKADAQRDVAKKEAEAESARAGAQAAEERQKAEQ